MAEKRARNRTNVAAAGTPRSLWPHQLHRLRRRGTARRQKTGPVRGSQKNAGHQKEGGKIHRTHPVEEALAAGEVRAQRKGKSTEQDR